MSQIGKIYRAPVWFHEKVVPYEIVPKFLPLSEVSFLFFFFFLHALMPEFVNITKTQNILKILSLRNENFQIKNSDIIIFLLKTQILDIR